MPPVYLKVFKLSIPKLEIFQVSKEAEMYERIRELAKAKGLSIPALEEKAKISQGGISKWKTSTPKADALYRVAHVLDTTVEYLLKGINRPATLANDGRLNSIISHLSSADPQILEAIDLILASGESGHNAPGDDTEGR
jgi:transcriptional regulator with XRE-family HTH domain